jgi:TatD DNase family protein
MKLIDTHCHIQDKQYDGDREEILSHARDNNVSMICVGTDLEMSQSAIALAQQSKDIWASVGLHPNDNLNEKYDNEIYAQLATDSKVVAIGEIGLDYYRTTDEDLKKFQRDRFLQQLDLAEQTQKPVIIHCRDAHMDMIPILQKRMNLRGVIHSFTGTLEEALVYVQLEFMIGLNGIVTFARQYDPTIQGIPLQNILLETDAPYLSPVPNRGQRNEPAYLVHVAQKIADIRSTSLEEVISVTTENAQNLFKL